MASSEPTLVPEWLRSNGHCNSGGGTAHHFASGNSHSDVSLLVNLARSRSSRTNSDIGNPRAILDRSPSINSWTNSSNNGFPKNPYSNFSRSHREKDRDNLESLGKESLRRSHSVVSRRQADSSPHSDASYSKHIDSSKHLQRNCMGNGDKPSSSVMNGSFEKDFPSLGADEKPVPNVVRVASPGLTIASQSLPIGNSALIGEGWSALAEVPVVIGSNSNAQSIYQPVDTSFASSTTSGVLNAVCDSSRNDSIDSNTASGTSAAVGTSGQSSGLNMAEALIQPPPATSTAQLSVETQRLEQLAMKKVKMLIPVTPSMPKVMNSSHKLKTKLNARYGDIIGVNKAGMQMLSSSVSAAGHASCGAPVISDASKQSHGTKLFVLKPPWENGASVTSKDGSNPENSGGKPTNSIVPNPTASSNPAKSPNSSKASLMARRSVFSPLTMTSTVEKQPFSSYAKSRSDFFNSVRKKTSMTTHVASEAINSILSLTEDKSCELVSASPCGTENGALIGKNDSSDDDHKLSTGENAISCKEVILDEEEAAFLHSLGWQENGDEEEELTEEEINAFHQELMKLNPSLNLSQGVQPLSLLMESRASKVGIGFPKVSSSVAAALKSN